MIDFTPKWTGPIEGYTVNYMRRHYWRLQFSMEWDDIMQECHCLFLKLCRARIHDYDADVNTAAWFMGIYKTALRNLVNDLAVDDSYLRECTLESQLAEGDSQLIEERISTEENEGALYCMVNDAPDEVIAVMSLFLYAPPDVYKLASEAWGRAGRKKEHGNAFLCSMLGIDVKVNVAQMTRDYFTGGNR